MARSLRQDLSRSTRAAARDLLYAASRVPLVGRVIVDAQTKRYNANDADVARLFNGLYPDFATAERAIPPGRESGYDNKRSAHRILNEWLAIAPSDYPMLFWLSQVLPASTYLFDWGGNVGLKYFAYRKYLSYSPALTWCVNDVPAVVAAGREIAQREGAAGLVFTTTLDELPEADVLLAAGVIHYIEKPFEMLAAAAHLPRHLIFSKVPAYDAPAAVTLQNMGTAFCANHLFNRQQLVQSVVALGYRLVDEWRSPEITCEIPFYPEHSVQGYSGFYFMQPS